MLRCIKSVRFVKREFQPSELQRQDLTGGTMGIQKRRTRRLRAHEPIFSR